MSNRRKTRRERQLQKQSRSGFCPNGAGHVWRNKPGYGVVCTQCGAKRASR